jgi:hypothetical protein
VRLRELADRVDSLMRAGYGPLRVVDGLGNDITEMNGPVPPGSLGDPEDCNTVQFNSWIDHKLRRETREHTS